MVIHSWGAAISRAVATLAQYDSNEDCLLAQIGLYISTSSSQAEGNI